MTEILFLTHNRLEFARASFSSLVLHTNWGMVDRLWIYDDSSTDGTQHEVKEFARRCPVATKVVSGEWGSPVTAMADFFQRATSPLLAKIDSDVMLPPGWLTDCAVVMDKRVDIDLLGIEARGRANREGHVIDPDCAPYGVDRDADEAEWIGGIGVFRRSAFVGHEPPHRSQNEGKWFGWQAWQLRNRGRVRAAWIKPSLQVFLLDRCSHEPWRSLSEEYIRRGWQRKEPYLYGPEWDAAMSWHKESVCA